MCHGEIGVILNRKKGWWRFILNRHILGSDLLTSLEVTRATDTFVPARQYDCPTHLIRMVQEHDALRESRTSLHSMTVRECPDARIWKLETVIKLCFAAERLDLERRKLDGLSPNSSDLSNLPRSLYWDRAYPTHTGFIYQGFNSLLFTNIHSGIFLGPSNWDMGLVAMFVDPELVKVHLRECLVATIQLKRNKCSGEPLMDIYGLVSSGDIIKFHKLSSTGEVSSSSMFLFTAEGLPEIWSHLREIVHEIQLSAPPPLSDKEYEIEKGGPPLPPIYEYKKSLMAGRWKLSPAGKPLEALDHGDKCEGTEDSKARTKAQRFAYWETRWLNRAVEDLGEPESDKHVHKCLEISRPVDPKDDRWDAFSRDRVPPQVNKRLENDAEDAKVRQEQSGATTARKLSELELDTDSEDFVLC